MPDNTIEMKENLWAQHDDASQVFHFIQKPVYNIDDMDDAMFMKDHIASLDACFRGMRFPLL